MVLQHALVLYWALCPLCSSYFIMSSDDILWNCSAWASWRGFNCGQDTPNQVHLPYHYLPFCWDSSSEAPSPVPHPTSKQKFCYSPLRYLCLSSSCCPHPTLLSISIQSPVLAKPFHLSTYCVAFQVCFSVGNLCPTDREHLGSPAIARQTKWMTDNSFLIIFF